MDKATFDLMPAKSYVTIPIASSCTHFVLDRCVNSNVRFSVMIDIDYERDPPLYDWRNFLTRADAVIARVGADKVVPGSAGNTQSKVRPGRNLSEWRREIAELLAEVHESYLTDLDDFETRTSPDKPKRWRADPPLDRDDPLYELTGGMTLDDGIVDGLEKYWVQTYGLRRANPGKSHTGGPPIRPLHNVYRLVRYWWTQNLGERFAPTFPYTKEEDGEVPVSEEGYPAALRFLLAVFQDLNPGYTAVNARALYDTMGKPSSWRKRKKGI